MKRKFIFALILFLALLSALDSLARPTGLILDKNWILTINGSFQKIELPYYQYPDQSGLVTFQTTFARPEGNCLVIPRISCYAFEVKVNNVLAAEIGDLDVPTANIWNYAHVISLDKTGLQENNTLTIRAYVLDDVGMHIPPFIDSKDKILGRISFYNFINTEMHFIMLGISFTVALILIAISIYNQTDKRMFFYLGLGTILCALYSFDCEYRLFSGDINSFLLIRKLLFASCYSSGALLILGIEKYTQKTLKIRKLIFFGIGIAVGLILFSHDFVELRSRFNYLNIFMIISPLSVLILLAKIRQKHLFFSMTFLTLVLTYTVITVLIKANAPYLFQYGIMVFSIGLGSSIIVEYTNMYYEKIIIYEKSLMDSLTTAYNRNILEEMDIQSGDILVLADLDNFKHYNDTFGHCSGDVLLKDVVSIVKSYLRKSDTIIRLGGDEFLIIMKNTIYHEAEAVINRIQKEFLRIAGDKKVDISFGIIEYESDFDSSYIKADKLMYLMKHAKKMV